MRPSREGNAALSSTIMSVTVMLSGAAAVGLGAALGALLRWMLALWLNPLHEGVPPGTWVANVAGGYMVGLAVAWFAQQPDLAPQWRLFVITGFLGGLTTFSTFSVEVLAPLQQGRLGTALAVVALHLGGSLLATWAGMLTVQGLGRA
jgi:CrcB protein